MMKCIKCNKQKSIPFFRQYKNKYCLDCLPDNKRCTHLTRKGKRCKLPSKPKEFTCKIHASKRFINNQNKKKTVSAWPGGRGPGFVYIVDLNKNNYYKIGQTGNKSRRLKDMQASNPWAKYVFCELVYNASHVEKMIHAIFKKQRLEREIFWLSKENIKKAKEIVRNNCFNPEPDDF